jgi:outer membrane protein OmpA-like peptidoglycan-associated protein
LTTVSYGEERPMEAGSTEQAYAKNRRVEIVYLK